MRLIKHTGIDDVETIWRRFEDSGVATPYQTVGWIRCWFESVAPAIAMQPMILTVVDDEQAPLAVLPLGLQVQRGVRVMRFLGGKHANYNMPVFGHGCMERIEPRALAQALKDFGKTLGIDLFVLDNQPVSWLGIPNPFAEVSAIPSPSSAWKCSLTADGQAMINGLMSSESRKKLRNKEKRLSEFGAISYRKASTSEDATRFLTAFLSQKAARFAALGIDNPFTEKGVQEFLSKASVTAQGQPRAISLFAMLCGDRILAVFGGAIHAGRYTGMFTSFDTDPAVSRFSPGDLLLMNLIKHLCSEGLHTFDLGTGEASYKNDYCTIEERLADCLLPITLKGQLAVRALALKQQVKRRVKQSEVAMNLISRMRKLRSNR